MQATSKKRRRSSGDSPNKRQKTSEKAVVLPKKTEVVVRPIGATVTTAPVSGTTVAVARAKPANPWANRTKKIPDFWGTTYHDVAHFSPTLDKPYHGVWGTQNRKTAKAWVTKARASVNANDDNVVASKKGTDGGYNFLVDMGEKVGYMSGALVPIGTRPEATTVAVYVDKAGTVKSVFPCPPEYF